MAPGGVEALGGRAATVRKGGMAAVASTITSAGTSPLTAKSRPLATGAVYASLLAQPAEGYAQACLALAGAKDPDYAAIKCPTLILAGEEDKTAPAATIEFLEKQIPKAKVEQMQGVGHWHLLEDVEKTAELLRGVV